MLRILIILTAILVAPIWAQDDLPEGPGKGATVRICTGCHGAEMWAGSRKGGNEWDTTITTMTEKGLAISDSDYATVLDYLSSCLGPATAKVNVNKAAACELSRVLAIPAQQADSIVEFRTKNGNFKDLAGLKKVEGLDAAAIDAKKEVITF
jgi:competence ComEA-like helix-hairpin-helix protein